MTDATLDAWLCEHCQSYNLIETGDCTHCPSPKPLAVTIHQISVNSPAAMELMGQQSQKAVKSLKSPSRGKKEASKRQPKVTKQSDLERDFYTTWERFGTGQAVKRQYAVKSLRYVTDKKRIPKTYNVDFAWPELMFAVECQGGTYVNGGHSRGAGYAADRRRIRDLSLMGWTVWEYTTDDLQPNTIYDTILEVNAKIEQIEAGLVQEIAA